MTTKEITAHDLRKNLKSILAETMSGEAEYTISYLGLPKKFKIVIADQNSEDDKPSALYTFLKQKEKEGILRKTDKKRITNKDIKTTIRNKYER